MLAENATKLDEAKELLRRAFALLNEAGYVPNVRPNDCSVAGETLQLLSAHPAPGPVVPVSSETEISRIPPADAVLQEPE